MAESRSAGRPRRRLLEEAHRQERRFLVPAGVLGQVWRDGRREVVLQRFVNADATRIEPLDRVLACACGVACVDAASADVIDASVAVLAKKSGRKR